MKTRIAIYGGTALSAGESWFIVFLTYALLKHADVIIVTGGFLSSYKDPGAVSTDFSVLQGAKKFAAESNTDLQSCFETWLPDVNAEIDPQKKEVVRFKEGNVKELKGESAQARRFLMVKEVDVIITVKGKKHTAMVADFAITINKPVLPLAFTGGDSREVWLANKNRIKRWFDLSDDFANELENGKVEAAGLLGNNSMINQIVQAIDKGIKTERLNDKNYKITQKELESDKNLDKKKISLFLSYSHKDEQLKEELDKHLTALKRSDKISVWHDKQIEGGNDWDATIKEELKNADLILLLISPDFMASDYIWEVEIKGALDNHFSGKSKVIPVFLRSVYIKDMPFDKLQGYISKNKPVTSFPEREQDGAFLKIVEGISSEIEKWTTK